MSTFSSNATNIDINKLSPIYVKINRHWSDLLLSQNKLELSRTILRPQQSEEIFYTTGEQLDSHLHNFTNYDLPVPDVAIILPRYTLSEHLIRYNTTIEILERSYSTQLHSFQRFILLSQTDPVSTDTSRYNVEETIEQNLLANLPDLFFDYHHFLDTTIDLPPDRFDYY